MPTRLTSKNHVLVTTRIGHGRLVITVGRLLVPGAGFEPARSYLPGGLSHRRPVRPVSLSPERPETLDMFPAQSGDSSRFRELLSTD